MTFHVITIFPELIKPYLKESVLGRGIVRKLVGVKVYNLRDFTRDKHHKVDDKPYGGGPGMVISVEPLAWALRKILRGKPKSQTKVLVTTPAGKQFNSQTARSLASRYKDVVIIAGRYEGLDERIINILKSKDGFGVRTEKISIGPYVLTGGELPALVVIDAIVRHIDGVLGKTESLEEKRLGVGVPVYTRPENFRFLEKSYKTPRPLLSGNHKKIEEWRKKNQKTG